METIYFIIFIGVCALAVVWASRRSKSETNLASRRHSKNAGLVNESLTTPASNRLSHKEEIWDSRCKQATKGFSAPQQFVPKFEAAQAAEYDGYSRRDRHHVTASEHVKKEAQIEGHGDFSMPSVEFDSKEQTSQA